MRVLLCGGADGADPAVSRLWSATVSGSFAVAGHWTIRRARACSARLFQRAVFAGRGGRIARAWAL